MNNRAGNSSGSTGACEVMCCLFLTYAPATLPGLVRKRRWLPKDHIHTLRLTLASRLIQNGMSVYELWEVLGLTDI